MSALRSERPSIPPRSRAVIAGRLRAWFGLSFPPTRERALDAAIARALESLGDLDAAELARRIELGDRAALDAVVREATVGETYFFRDPSHFELLASHVFPAAAALRGGRVRLWSAACATGEEAYSLAICALEWGIEPEVFATDLNERFLERARGAVYGPWSFRGVPDDVISRWFHDEGRLRRVRDEVRAHVRFSPLNLIDPEPGEIPRDVDAILCRNVLIYFEPEAIVATAHTLVAALAEGGVIVTGPSDPSLPERLGLVAESHPSGLLYRRGRRGEAEVTRTERAAPEPEPEPTPPPKSELRIRASLPPPLPPPPPPAGPAPTGDVVGHARALVARGEVDAARSVHDDLLRTPALDPEPYVLRATLRQDALDDEGALEDLRRATLLERDLPIANLLASVSLRRTGDGVGARRALARCRAALLAAPPDAEAAYAGGAKVRDLLAMERRLSSGDDGRGRR